MPLRPFPHALRVGTDICNVSRVRQMLARKGDGLPYLDRFTKKLLTPPERAYFWDRFGPLREIQPNLSIVSEFLAGRFAAKEAIRKACEHFEAPKRGFQSIMILPVTSSPRHKHQSTRPQGLVLDVPYKTGIVAPQPSGEEEQIAHSIDTTPIDIDELDGQLCEISISHDGDFATAVALVSIQRH